MQNYNPINSLYLVLMIITSLLLSLSACLSYDSWEKEREDMITTTNENKISETEDKTNKTEDKTNKTKDKTNETKDKTNETEVNSNETEHKPGSHFNIK